MNSRQHAVHTLPGFLLGSKIFRGALFGHKTTQPQIVYRGTKVIPTTEELTFVIRIDPPTHTTLLCTIEDFYSSLGYSSDVLIEKMKSLRHDSWEFAGELFPPETEDLKHHIYITGRYKIGHSRRVGAKIGTLHIRVIGCPID